MRAALAILLLSASAHADPLDAAPDGHATDLHAAAGAIATRTAAQSTASTTLEVGADASAAGTIADDADDAGFRGFAGAHAEATVARGGDLPGLGWRVGGYLGYADALDPVRVHGTMLPIRIGVSYAKDAVPLASAARELARRPFDRQDVELDFWAGRGGEHGWTWGFMHMHADIWSIAQQGVALEGDVIQADVLGLCGHADDARFCFGAPALDDRHADGGLLVESVAIAPVALRSLDVGDVHVDARVGWGWGDVWLPGHYPKPIDPDDPNALDNQKPCDQTGDCVQLRTGSYDVHLTAPAGPTTIDLRAARTIFPTYDGEILVEDRGEAALAWQDDSVAVTAQGFAAYARRWILAGDRLVRGPDEATGGGNVSVAYTRDDWQLAASAGAARTDYAILDGNAPAPAFAATGALSIRRDWKDALKAPTGAPATARLR